MSNSNVNSELSAESKTSFITVTSMMASMDMCSDSEKEKEEINLNSLDKICIFNSRVVLIFCLITIVYI